MNVNEWTNYIYELHQYMKQQENRINKLEVRVNQLEADMQETKPNTIEKIEYNFDQLKIEHLDGTLHIGLSPNDLANIEDLGVHQEQAPSYPPPLKQTLHSELSSYLQETGPSMIRDLATQYDNTVDEAYQSILIQDMVKQLPGRIAFYEQEAVKKRENKTEEQLHSYITDQIKNEIHQSLMKYMQINNQKGE